MNIKHIFIWAILLRFLIMPFTFHPDLKDHHQRTSYFRTQGILNIYEFLRKDAYTREHNLDFSYPPVTYFSLGSYQFLISPILGSDFLKWTHDYSDYRYNSSFLFRYLFSLKFIYLLFEILTGFLIYKFLKNPKEKYLSLLFWFFNPINLYAIYAIGQFDIIPTFLSVLAYFLWIRKRIFYAGLSLGMAVAFKTFPLLFLPFYLITKNNIKNKIIFLFSTLSVYAVTILPFINSKEFQSDVLFSGLSTRIFQLTIPIAGYHISIFLILYLLLITYSFFKSKMPLYILFIITLLLTFSTIRFHPQWITWLMPYLAIAYGKNIIGLKYIIPLTVSYFIYFIFFGDSFLTTGLLSPISTLYLEIPPFTEIIPDNYQYLVIPFIQILFALVCLIIGIKLLRNKLNVI